MTTGAIEIDCWYETRWLCPKCGRFLAESSIGGEDVYDPINSYYGFYSRIWGDCKKCGRVDEPNCVPTKAHPIDPKEYTHDDW